MRISDWSSGVCSSDLAHARRGEEVARRLAHRGERPGMARELLRDKVLEAFGNRLHLMKLEPAKRRIDLDCRLDERRAARQRRDDIRSEERRGGKACVSTCRSRWSPYLEKKNKPSTQ